MRRLKVLAVAAGSGRVGYVLLVGGELRYWQLSQAAARSPADATRYARNWIEEMRPQAVVTERIAEGCRKGERAKAVIKAIARTAENELLLHISIQRPRRFPNKYVEAEAFANRFPELRRFVPKPRRLWDAEPRNTTIFEALALGLAANERGGDARAEVATDQVEQEGRLCERPPFCLTRTAVASRCSLPTKLPFAQLVHKHPEESSIG